MSVSVSLRGVSSYLWSSSLALCVRCLVGLTLNMDQSFEYFTCLRHPVSRAVSHYHHMRTARPVQLGDISMEDWVLNLPDNFYVRHLNGPTVLNLPPGALNSSHLLRAMTRLRQFKGVMIMESLNTSQEQLASWFGWRITDPSKSRRGTMRNSTPIELPSATTPSSPLFPLFQLDFVLYGYAQLLNARITDAAAALATTVASSPLPAQVPFPRLSRRCGADFCCGWCLWADF